MKKVIFPTMCCTLILASIATSVRATDSHKTIDYCATLLPGGYSFTLNISGYIDTKSEQRELNGSFSIIEDSGADGVQMKKALRPFIECVQPLIK